MFCTVTDSFAYLLFRVKKFWSDSGWVNKCCGKHEDCKLTRSATVKKGANFFACDYMPCNTSPRLVYFKLSSLS